MKKLLTLFFLAATALCFGQWVAKASIPAVTAQEGLVAHPNGNIYLFNGYTATFPITNLNALYIYNIASDTWTTGASANFTVRAVGYCLGSDNYIYAFGGSGGGMQGFNAFERYNVATDTWSTLASPGTGCWEGSAACYNNKIYYAGGETFEHFMRIYDIPSGTWSTGTNIPTGVKQHKIVSGNNGYLYVFGGRDSTSIPVNLVQRYDIAADTWSTVATLPVQKNSFGACLAPDGRIYLVCGKDAYGNGGGPFFNDVTIFNPCDNSWSAGALHPIAFGELAVTSGTNGIFAMGGRNAAGLDSNYFLPVAPVNLAYPAVTATFSPQQVCANASATITAAGANTYSWSTGSASTSVIVAPSANTNYTVTGTNTLGCSDTVVVSINVTAVPVLTTATTGSLICSGTSVTLTVGGATSYTWMNTSSSPSIVVTPTTSTNYTVAGESNGCTSTALISQSVSICTGIALSEGENVEVWMYPNPGAGLLHLDLTSFSENTQVEVYDAMGRLILSQTVTALRSDLNFKDAANGIYTICLVKNRQNVYHSKVIKQ